MELLSEAICFAARAFDGALRKGDGAPAALHAMEAACIAATLTREEAALAAAALHDTVEDAGVTREELAERFGERVAALVMSDTEDKMRHLPPSQTWRARKEATVERMRRSEDPGEAAVCLADKLSNMRSIYRGTRERGADFWLAFSQRDPEPSQLQGSIRNEILPGPIGLNNGLNQIFRHILIVCQQLLGVLWQAVPSVTEAGVIIVAADPGIQANTLNDLPSIQAFAFRICIQLIEVANS